MLEYKLNGLDALDRALTELPLQLQRNVLRGGLRAAAGVIAADAKERVPVDKGTLRDSIRISVRLRRGVPVARVRAGSAKAWYAHIVEFGAKAHVIKPKKAQALAVGAKARETVHHPGARQQPFMRPAMDASAQAALAAFATYVRRRLTKAGVTIPDPEEGG